jgi:hypothetical protein
MLTCIAGTSKIVLKSGSILQILMMLTCIAVLSKTIQKLGNILKSKEEEIMCQFFSLDNYNKSKVINGYSPLNGGTIIKFSYWEA